MKNIVIILTLVIILLAPTTTHAAWWDFIFGKQTASLVEPTALPTETFKPTPTETAPVVVEMIVEVEKIVEKPVEKIVTKTVTVDNPELIKQINDWKLKYSALEAQNNKLTIEITQLKTDLTDSKRSRPLVEATSDEAKCLSINDQLQAKVREMSSLPSSDVVGNTKVFTSLAKAIENLKTQLSIICK
jgi:hypothetical protein